MNMPFRPAPDTPTAPLFEVAGASFTVDGRRLVGPLDLAFPAGRMTGLIGRNGSGKSTLLKLLARQDAPSAGAIRHAGAELAGFAARAFARKVAFLPQTCPPVPGMRVEELVALGRYPWHGALGRRSEADRAAIAEAIRVTGLESYAARDVESLSGGERQRAFIAMLIAQGADCLLLDEPISALDVAHQVEVLALLAALCRQRGIGIVVVLHDINLAARFCDHLVALRDGRLVAEGEPRAILRAERLEAIYGQAFEVLESPQGHALAFPV
ncbi:iron-hydroxamate transporter ATP-binding protein [Aureimonas endophytica]|uniref:Iron-hydroxamate transporter ATP-binding protein n=1 Tax=Aureimonas endophytica TaxID=2027858 RepID=A0A916ZEV5_9HYPH|nr:ATP-binding cassette domain-containing protein [Aureimonas endophytica]GGD92891.1 iron-hydroxamate transporter ATP-binding protein [Aureimonas endophytica]